MNAQAILIKIEEDAKETAGRIKADATARAEERKAASREKIEGMYQAMLAQAAREGDELEQRMLRMAELDARKALLQKKRALMDEAFERAAALLAELPNPEKRAYFQKQIVRCATGSETLRVGDRQAGWYDDAFIAEVNRALEGAGKPGKLVASGTPYPGCTGVVLLTGGAEVHCTMEAALEEARVYMEQQVAAELFTQA